MSNDLCSLAFHLKNMTTNGYQKTYDSQSATIHGKVRTIRSLKSVGWEKKKLRLRAPFLFAKQMRPFPVALLEFGTSRHAECTIMIAMVMLHANTSIVKTCKSYGPAKSSKNIHFLHDTKNVTTGIEKTFDMTAMIILVIPLIILLNGNRQLTFLVNKCFFRFALCNMFL